MSEDEYKQILKTYIDEVLHYVWDPLGVRDVPQARYEYSRYAKNVWQDVLKGKSKLEISSYLTRIVTEQMELKPNPGHDDEVADIVLDWDRFLKHP